MNLNYKHLFYFYTICQEGSIVRASRKLNVTQPTLSGQLKQFEIFLGVRLFERETRKLVLNDKGHAIYDYAKQIFKLGEELVRSARTPLTPTVAIVKIGILPSLSKFLIYDFLVPLLADRHIAITVTEETLPVLMAKLKNEEVDLVLSDIPGGEYGSKTKSSLLKHREFVVVSNKSFAKLKKGFPKSLAGVPFVTFTEHSQLRSEINQYFEKNKIYPAIVGEFDDITLLRLIVERGRCVTVLPKSVVADSILSGRLVEIGSIPSLQSHVWAITGKKSMINDAVNQTISAFKKAQKS